VVQQGEQQRQVVLQVAGERALGQLLLARPRRVGSRLREQHPDLRPGSAVEHGLLESGAIVAVHQE
jgi:hypothetical protein